jgi:regulator of sigma E protease
MFHIIPDFARSVVAFIVVLGVLVFVHEMGHYLAARLVGVHVEAFAIGFGRPFAAWTDKGGTQWKLAWIPLGGYVKLHGQERPQDVSAAVRASWKPGRTFHAKSVGARAIVVAAGPIANFLLAMVLFSVLFVFVGRPIATPVVGEVMPDSAAAHAGLLVNDRIVAIDGQPIERFEDIQRIVTAHPGDKLSLNVQRDSHDITVAVTTDQRDGPGGTHIGVLGIRGADTQYQRLAPLTAIGAGVAQTWDITVQTLQGVGEMIARRRGTEDLGGPLRIAQLSGQVAELGVASLVSFIGLLSVNLGLINLFPIPILDGGHLLFFLAEAVRGRPLPVRAQEYGFRAGFALLIGLFVFATWNDLSHLGLVRWVAGVIG